jgi:polynucleotide 5'-hydroxyl-kinase GRC3/NOL9
MSAVAARKARQQQAQISAPKHDVDVEIVTEPPPKRPRRSIEAGKTNGAIETETRGPRTRSSTKQDISLPAEDVKGRRKKDARPLVPQAQGETNEEEEADEGQADGPEEMSEDEVASVAGDADGYESPADTSTELQNFPLSKARLNKSTILYADEDTLCVRLKERMVCANRLEYLIRTY